MKIINLLLKLLVLAAAGIAMALFFANVRQIGSLVWFGSGEETIKIATTTTETPRLPQKETQTGKLEESPVIMPPEKINPAPKSVSVPAVSELPAPSINQVAGEGALTRNGIIKETNKQRQIFLGTGHDLKESALLDAAAAKKVKDMFDAQYFDHVSPSGKNPAYFIGSSGYEYVAIGENLAKGDYENDADVVLAWMESPGHRENILKSGYLEIGVAVGYGNIEGRKTWLAVQEFAVPQSACPKMDAGLADKIDSEKKNLDQLSAAQKNLLEQINLEKTRIDALEKELAESTKNADIDQIKSKYQEINQAIGKVNEDVENYNRAINQIKSIYGGYKALIEKYNLQVAAYNRCVDALD